MPFLWLGAFGLLLSILGIIKKNDKRGKSLWITLIILRALNILETIIGIVFLYLLAMGMNSSPALYY